MANRQDIAMLQNAIQNTGSDIASARQQEFERQQAVQRTALEAQLRDIQEKRYEAQGSHYQEIEAQNAGANATRAQNEAKGLEIEGTRAKAETDRASAQQEQQDAQQKQQLFSAAVALNATGQLPDSARESFNDFLANDEHFGKTGLQIQAPDPKYAKGTNKQSAIAAAVQAEQNYREQAQQTDDPDEQAQLNGYADQIAGWVKKSGSFAGAQPSVTTKVSPLTDKITGKPLLDTNGAPQMSTNTTTRMPIGPSMGYPPPPPAATAAPLSMTGGAGLPASPSFQMPSSPGAPPPLTMTPPPAGPGTGGLPVDTSASPQGMVRVRHPNGQTGTIPAGQLQQAIQLGYTQVSDGSNP